jgi:hypothetical protein
MLAFVLLVHLPGLASIYGGGDKVFRGIKEHRPVGDDAIRPMSPPAPEEIARYGWTSFERIKSLIAWRRRHAWLSDAHVAVTEPSTTRLVIEVRECLSQCWSPSNINAWSCEIATRFYDRMLLGEGCEWQDQRQQSQARIGPRGWVVLGRD